MFPSRAFRHSAIYIRTDRGIGSPRDLAGRVVGVREYSMTAALVARGVLEDDFGLRAAEVRWRYGPADAGDSAPIVRVRPDGVELLPLAGGANLSDALRDGVLDALVAYKPPPAFLDGAPNVGRLFVDSAAVEADYARRRNLSDHASARYPPRDRRPRPAAVPAPVLKRRGAAVARTEEAQAPFTSLPWAPDEAARSRRVLGDDFWSYGVAGNRPALEALCRYFHAQGIAARPVTVDELFVPATVDWLPS